MSSLICYGLLLLGVFIGSVSQVMLKKASMRQYKSPLREYLNPIVLAAYTLFAVGSLLIVLAYREVPLSMGPILETSSYFYVTLFSIVVFHERITLKKIMALGCIMAGTAVYALLG